MGCGARSWTRDQPASREADVDRRALVGSTAVVAVIPLLSHAAFAQTAKGKECRAGPRSLCRWLEPVRGDSAIAGSGTRIRNQPSPNRDNRTTAGGRGVETTAAPPPGAGATVEA